MAAPPFDPLNPPSAGNPLPGYGNAPSMRLLTGLMRRRPEQSPPLSEEEAALLAEIRDALEASLRPAPRDEVAGMLIALLSHFPVRPMSDSERAAVARDWVIDLSPLPADIIAAACQQWRRGANAFAPNPGQLLALAKPVLDARRFYHRVAEQWIAARDAGSNEG